MPEMGYTMLITTPTDETGMPGGPGAINGGMFPREGSRRSPVITIDVEDIDAALEKIESAGGTVAQAKAAFPWAGPPISRTPKATSWASGRRGTGAGRGISPAAAGAGAAQEPTTSAPKRDPPLATSAAPDGPRAAETVTLYL